LQYKTNHNQKNGNANFLLELEEELEVIANNTKHKKSQKQSGVVLFEILIVLIISSMILSASWFAVSNFQKNYHDYSKFQSSRLCTQEQTTIGIITLCKGALSIHE